MADTKVNALTDLLQVLLMVGFVVVIIAAYSLGPDGIDKLLTKIFGSR